VTRRDARQASESVGPIAGNSIAAMFGFAEGVDGYYESKAAAADPKAGRRNQIEITCSKGVVLINEGAMEQYLLGDPPLSPDRQQSWELLGPPEWRTMKPPERFAQCKLHIAEDLLRAIEEDREPLTSGAAAAVAIEMIQAVYAAHLAGSRLTMPLAQREHPLDQHAQN
jgi:predicted dehydrogenase